MKKLSLLCLFLFLFSTNAFATTMVAHKGRWKDFNFPQNSLAGLLAAVDGGYSALEFDVRLTKDGHLVLAHDDELKGVSDCKGLISESALQDVEKCTVDKSTLLPITQLLTKKIKKPTLYTTLKKVLPVLMGDPRITMIWLDLKSAGAVETTAALKEALVEIDPALYPKLILNHMDIEVLRLGKLNFPGVKTSLEGKWGAEPLVESEKYLGDKKIHDYVSLNVGLPLGHGPLLKTIGRKNKFRKMLKAFMVQAKAKGVPVIAWTVNSTKKIKAMLEYDFDYLLTDRADL